MSGYAEGGYIGPPDGKRDRVPILLSRGCVLMTTRQIKALGGRKAVEALYPDTDIEIVYTADEVRAAGSEMLRRLEVGDE